MIGIPACWNPVPFFAVTTSLKASPSDIASVRAIAAHLGLPFFLRKNHKVESMFGLDDSILRFLVVQTGGWLLIDRGGDQLRYHPNMGYVRLGNRMRGEVDHLLAACALRDGDKVLDATLGYAGEALLCAHEVGPLGVVHGIEAVPELGLIVSQGLATLETQNAKINAVMRRIEVVHLGHHLEYLMGCADNTYDVICFDPFFEEQVGTDGTMSILRNLGNLEPLCRGTLAEACRVARKRVIVKATKWSGVLDDLIITNVVGSRSGKVCYGILQAD